MKKQENKSRYAILGMLTIAPMSGYDLKKFTEKTMDYFWNENYAWLYPTLKQLEQERLITSVQEKQEGRPEKRVYSLTETGQATLRRWLSEPSAINQIERNEFLLKLFFSDQVPIAVTLKHVQDLHENLQSNLTALKDLNRQAVEAAQMEPVPPGRIYRQMTLNYGLHAIQAQIVWCEETIAQLEAQRQSENPPS